MRALNSILLAALASCAALAHAATALPGLAAKASELAALPDGGWLSVDKQGLHLLDAGGKERARLKVRAKHLDLRAQGSGALAVVMDANAEQVLPVLVDWQAGTLATQAPFPAPPFGIESTCLYRDAQQIDHLFVIGKDGQAEQWLMHGDQRQLVRKLALPPHTKHCRADDAAHQLLVNENSVGLWAYNAEAEGAPERKLLKRGGTERKGEVVVRPWPAPASARTSAADSAKAIVVPRGQTEPVARTGDAADDPAIWRNPSDPAGARILGTNKKQGLLVYNLDGKELQLLEVGRLNNVDVRQDVTVGGNKLDLAVATQRDDNSVMLFTIAANGVVTPAGAFATGLDNIYGMCLYRPADGGLEAFINDKDGSFLQYRIEGSAEAMTGKLLRRFKVGSQPEGCVVDDRNQRLFLGEEKRGVWTVSARGDAPARLTMVMPVGPQLVADVEGMGLYQGAKASYLVVSSQGDNSYLVLDAQAPYRVRGSFRVGYNLAAGIDGTSETDGLEVSSANFGGAYAKGMLVIQDGYKRLPDGPQNFKYVAWEDVAKALNLD
ncbi:3-phytase (myo-inositol-hexaphosphate 3-phosphohydrolase) [Duganella sp. CF402]|uniref:phytase n=1 Tax=unclassified Duganella TaxID=2636909 RepID=UPI0008CDE345|nr:MULTISPECIES: phytase [unclassified Duganella]RZT10233.1 myo-inositol-hexaphosphate 3-phosphohydrolase [Duganella sp. BK701]SEL22458.1 3-phytase (myo-inositol-hexaphosphate 3-phosphohydrolase) [Duganella sp. CF402]